MLTSRETTLEKQQRWSDAAGTGTAKASTGLAPHRTPGNMSRRNAQSHLAVTKAIAKPREESPNHILIIYNSQQCRSPKRGHAPQPYIYRSRMLPHMNSRILVFPSMYRRPVITCPIVNVLSQVYVRCISMHVAISR